MKLKQLAVRANGLYAALADNGRVYEQYRAEHGHLKWRPLDPAGLEEARLVNIAARGDRIVGLDRDGQVWEQGSDGRLGSTYSWSRVDLAGLE